MNLDKKKEFQPPTDVIDLEAVGRLCNLSSSEEFGKLVCDLVRDYLMFGRENKLFDEKSNREILYKTNILIKNQ